MGQQLLQMVLEEVRFVRPTYGHLVKNTTLSGSNLSSCTRVNVEVEHSKVYNLLYLFPIRMFLDGTTQEGTSKLANKEVILYAMIP